MSKLLVGTTYDVSFEDCCIRGSFTARLIHYQEWRQEEDVIPYLLFDNGIRLEEWGQVFFKEVEGV